MAGAIVSSDLVTVGLANATSYSPDTTFSYSGTSGNVLIVAVHGTDRVNAGGISDVTCQVDGVAMTPLAGAIHTGGDGFPLVRLFASTGLSAGNKSITAFFRGRACTVFAMEVSGLDDSDLVANTSVIESADSTYSHSYTPTASGNFIISFLATQGGSGGSFSPDTGMTEELDTFTGTTSTSDVGSWIGYRDAPGTSAIDVGATPALDEQLVFGVVEFNAAGGGGSGNTVAAATGSIILAGYAATVAQSVNRVVAPQSGGVTFAGYSPSIGITISPPAGGIAIAGFAPTITRQANNAVAPGAGSIVFTGRTSSVFQGNATVISAPSGSLILTGYPSAVSQTANITVSAQSASLNYRGYVSAINGALPLLGHRRHRLQFRRRQTLGF